MNSESRIMAEVVVIFFGIMISVIVVVCLIAYFAKRDNKGWQ